MKLHIDITVVSPGRHRVTCPSLPGCFADAATPDEAKEAIRYFINSYLHSLDAIVPAEIELVNTAAEGRSLEINHAAHSRFPTWASSAEAAMSAGGAQVPGETIPLRTYPFHSEDFLSGCLNRAKSSSGIAACMEARGRSDGR